ncbi:MAG: flagellar biosynthetic protein FliO, partial [Myxococcota bacterium]
MRRMMTTGALAATFTLAGLAEARAQEAAADTDPYAELLKQGGTPLPDAATQPPTGAPSETAATVTSADSSLSAADVDPFGPLGLFGLGALLLCGAAIAFARIQKRRGVGLDADMYHVKSMKLSARHQISVVVVHGRSYVLGVADGCVNVLDRLDHSAPEQARASHTPRSAELAAAEDLAKVWEQMFTRVTEHSQQTRAARMAPGQVPTAYDGLFSEFSEAAQGDQRDGDEAQGFSDAAAVETLPNAPGARP